MAKISGSTKMSQRSSSAAGRIDLAVNEHLAPPAEAVCYAVYDLSLYLSHTLASLELHALR